MSNHDIELWADQRLPSRPIEWADGTTGEPADLSTASFTLEFLTGAVDPRTIVKTKSAGFTGAATYPNVIIDWAADDITDLAGDYSGRLVATVSGERWVFPRLLSIHIHAAPVAAP